MLVNNVVAPRFERLVIVLVAAYAVGEPSHNYPLPIVSTSIMHQIGGNNYENITSYPVTFLTT
jgi:hypothetical protein